ncbi:hypothetical protein Slin15195_G061100 [Septoria linicola]|uniref:Uncharacterized protein n=1 Tax=Septoria linicola TaxID=215465 RepID=A0A9Q9AVX2_9PEZI|nr:hypothetical protein Slin15195_G061100 [Septoria linicola]
MRVDNDAGLPPDLRPDECAWPNDEEVTDLNIWSTRLYFDHERIIMESRHFSANGW